MHVFDEYHAWREGHYPEDHEPGRYYLNAPKPGEPLAEDDEPRPDVLGPTPRWFIVAFALAALCCGCTGLAGLIAWIAGAFS